MDSDSEELNGYSEDTIEETKNLKRRAVENEIEDKYITSKKKKLKDLYAPPTVEELNQLRETQNLFNSNLFRLQIEEILKEITPKPKVKQQLKSWLDEFKKAVFSIEESGEFSLTDLTFLENWKIKLPFDKLPAQENGVFKYMKPCNIDFVNLCKSNCSIGPKMYVDILLEVPTKCFHKTDKLNAKYLLKRAIYLSCIATKLKNHNKFKNSYFTYQNGNLLKPILQFKLNKQIDIRILFSVQPANIVLKYAKFNPVKNNIRGIWLFENDDNFESSTPFYNSCILEDLTISENELLRSEILNDQMNIQNGIRLLQVWLKQRELDTGFGSFTPELLSMFIVYLIENKKLNNAMSSYQIIRNVWIELSESQWFEFGKGISLCKTKKDAQPSLDEFHQFYPVVFIDRTGFYNLASFLNLQIYLKVKEEAKKAILYLDNRSINSFRLLFTTKMPFTHQHDQIVQIKTNQILKNYQKLIERHIRLDYVTFQHPPVLNFLLDVVKVGLNDRVINITPKLNKTSVWSSNEKPPNSNNVITIGFSLNPDRAFTVIDKGPAANMPEAKEFREFWGEKSQLRRFNDGLIAEAIVWDETPTIRSKRLICEKIINYLLSFKCNINEESVNHFCDQLTSNLIIKSQKSVLDYQNGEEIMMKVIASFDELSIKLRNLKNIPLEIVSVRGTSNIFRYTDVFPCLITQVTLDSTIPKKKWKKEISACITPFEVVIHLSYSGKWPDNLEAIRRLKAAFYLKMAASLEKELNCIVHPEYLDIEKDNFMFRIRIANNKEISLIKKTLDDDGLVKYRDTEESLQLERKFVHLPQFTSALFGLQSQHPSFGTAVRLTKFWLRSHLLDETHIPDIVVDLLVASLYTSPDPYDIPHLPQIAFIRFLQKMIISDWNNDLLVVNFNNEMNFQQLNDIEARFNKNRSTLPPLFIATPYNQENSIWTQKAPSLQILGRISMLAKESLAIIENKLNDEHNLNLKVLFNTSLNGYDAFIELKNISFSQKVQHESGMIISEDFVQLYLSELREAYGEFALFFHNTYGGNMICVLWKPKVLENKEFKVSHVNGRKLVLSDKKPELCFNREAILEDFLILGKGIVKCVRDSNNFFYHE